MRAEGLALAGCVRGAGFERGVGVDAWAGGEGLALREVGAAAEAGGAGGCWAGGGAGEVALEGAFFCRVLFAVDEEAGALGAIFARVGVVGAGG